MLEGNTIPESFRQSFPQYKEGGEQVQPILESEKLAKLPVVGKKILSSKSNIKLPEGILGEPRPLALRRLRRELYEQLKNTPKKDKEIRKQIIEKGHQRDLLAQEFIKGQQEVIVNLGDLGDQMAQYSVLVSPDVNAKDRPPVILLPGVSNDMENMGMLPLEIAYKGRNVIALGFPEGWKGDVTQDFAKAAESSKNYEPHSSFFKKAIDNIKNDPNVKDKMGDFDKFDLWGYSAGSVITAEMLLDKDFSEKVANAALICPPNCVDQELKEFKILGRNFRTVPFKAIIYEQWNTLRPKNFKDSPKRNITNRHSVDSNSEMRARKVRTYDALASKVTKKDEWWKRDFHISEGGKITVVSYDNDKMTLSVKALPEIKQNNNLNVIELSGGHQTCLIKPEELVLKLI